MRRNAIRYVLYALLLTLSGGALIIYAAQGSGATVSGTATARLETSALIYTVTAPATATVNDLSGITFCAGAPSCQDYFRICATGGVQGCIGGRGGGSTTLTFEFGRIWVPVGSTVPQQVWSKAASVSFPTPTLFP